MLRDKDIWALLGLKNVTAVERRFITVRCNRELRVVCQYCYGKERRNLWGQIKK